jgi:hypothetical protein
MRKYVLIAPVLCAIPAMAFGQATVSCPEDRCTHIVSVFKGEGGLIAEVDGADMATWVAACDGVIRTGELPPNDDGVIAMVFDLNNGLACDADGGSFELGPVKDGGWYWITDAPSSASGNLLAKDVLDNTETTLTDAGPGVEKTPGKGATLLRETSTGRMGILPTILPVAATSEAEVRKCGFNDRGSNGTDANATADQANAQYTRRLSECALGDGGTITLATTTNSFTGTTTAVADKSTLTRPAGTGSVVVTIDLWGNHSGHFTTATTGHALLGQPSIAMSDLRAVGRLTGVTWSAKLGAGPTRADLANGVAQGGITMAGSDTNVVTFTIQSNDDYCSDDNNHSATVSVTALMTDAASAAQTTPSRTRNSTSMVVGGTSFTIVCPP